MNLKFFGICVLAAAVSGAASAKEHRLPDGTVISVIHDGTTNIVRGNSLTTVVSECKGAPLVCTTTKVDTATTPGLLTGAPQALAGSLGLALPAHLLRPTKTEVYNDSYSGGSYAEGGNALSYVDQSRHSYRTDYFSSYYGYQVPQAPAPNPPCINCKG